MNRLLRSLPFAAYLTMCPNLWVVDAMAAGMCDAAVLTAIDSSASIDAAELAIEIDGMAFAIQSPELLRTIQSGPNGCITMAAYLWGSNAPVVVLDWHTISNEAEAKAAAEALQAVAKTLGNNPAGNLTDTSSALVFAYQMLARTNVMTSRQILNVLTDDPPNQNGDKVPMARAALIQAGAQINGVAIGSADGLVEFLSSQVVGGTGHFVMVITQAENMAAAMVSKFRREIAQR
jgi:hypothetical protein